MTPRIPEEAALSQNSWGPRTSQEVPDPRRVPDRIYYPDTSAGRNRHPAWGWSGAATCQWVRARARDRVASPGRLAYLPYSIRLAEQSPKRLLPGCTVGRVLPRRTVQSLAPPMPRMSVYYASWTRRLGFAHYDAYTVASTDYAASYIAPTGASPMGQIKTSLGQRSQQGNEAYPRRDSQPL